MLSYIIRRDHFLANLDLSLDFYKPIFRKTPRSIISAAEMSNPANIRMLATDLAKVGKELEETGGKLDRFAKVLDEEAEKVAKDKADLVRLAAALAQASRATNVNVSIGVQPGFLSTESMCSESESKCSPDNGSAKGSQVSSGGGKKVGSGGNKIGVQVNQGWGSPIIK